MYIIQGYFTNAGAMYRISTGRFIKTARYLIMIFIFQRIKHDTYITDTITVLTCISNTIMNV